MAALNKIHLRTGAFCNPGACAAALGLTAEDVKSNFEAGHVCWDDQDLIQVQRCCAAPSTGARLLGPGRNQSVLLAV